MEFRYLAVEGLPGLGKTTVARRLAETLGGETVLDDTKNPFLDDFLDGRAGAAFQAQVFFLLSRYRQLSELAQRGLFKSVEVADFILPKDRIYAYLNLDDTELMLYEKIYPQLASSVPSPELVVYLQAPADTLVKRLRKSPTRVPDEAAIRELVRAYDYFFFHYSQTPLLVVSCAEVDYRQPDADIADLVQEIQLMAGGTRYYVPAAD